MLPEAFHDISKGQIAGGQEGQPRAIYTWQDCIEDCDQGEWPWDKTFTQHAGEEIETLNQLLSYLLKQMNSKNCNLG